MRYVIKIGTSSLFNEDGTAKESVLESVLETIKDIFSEENEVVLVVSGAVACGKAVLKQMVDKFEKEEKTKDNDFYKKYKKIQDKINFQNMLRKNIVEIEKKDEAKDNSLYNTCKELLKKANLTTIEKSIIAGIGQTEMMRIIQDKAFDLEILTEQVLLSGRDDLKRSTAVKNLNKCFESRILAVVNANDTVYEEELADEVNKRFSDNDTLASDLARIIKADRLFLITNVEGYLDDNNKVVKEITIDKGVDYLKKTKLTKSVVGSGGMYSKLGNALAFAKTGGMAFIISVNNIKNILEISEQRMYGGTRIYNGARLNQLISKKEKNWIFNTAKKKYIKPEMIFISEK